MTGFKYRRFCPLARALDVIGDRWTLVILDTLSIRSCRYKDLQSDLPGIGSNVLSERLKKLEEANLVSRRTQALPEKGIVYELTARGRELEPVLIGLRKFGLGALVLTRAPEPSGDVEYSMGHSIPDSMDIDESYQWEVDDQVFHLVVQGKDVVQRLGPTKGAAVTVVTTHSKLERVIEKKLSLVAARDENLVRIRGKREAIERMLHAIGEPSVRLNFGERTR